VAETARCDPLTGLGGRRALDVFRPTGRSRQGRFQLHDVRERLEVVYQPIWDTARHAATAVEALPRWRTDAGTLAPPRDCLGRLSHAGHRELTDLMLERAVHALRGIHAGREMPLALNVNVWPDAAGRPRLAAGFVSGQSGAIGGPNG